MAGFQQMSDALGNLIQAINADYAKWSNTPRKTEISRQVAQQMYVDFVKGVRVEEGRKYIKVITGGSVHCFIVKNDDPKKGLRAGDILKAASWAAPALNFTRGNVFDKSFSRVRWTGVM